MGRYFALICRDKNDWMIHQTSRKHEKLEAKGFFLFFILPENAAGIFWHSQLFHFSAPSAILWHFYRLRTLQYQTKCENGSDNTNCDLKYLHCRHTRAQAFLWQQQVCSGFLFALVFSGTKQTSI